jgi:hypothetical protein
VPAWQIRWIAAGILDHTRNGRRKLDGAWAVSALASAGLGSSLAPFSP